MPQESTIEEVMYKINLTAQVLKGMHNYPNKMLLPNDY